MSQVPGIFPILSESAMHVDAASVSPLMVFSCVSTHRDLWWQLTKREVMSRYRGSVAGILWAVIHPLIMLSMYTLIFHGIWGARWNVQGDSAFDFGLLVFAGLIVHSLFADTIQRAPNLVVNHSVYVKKIVFPLEVLAWISLCTSLFYAGFSLVVLMLFYAVMHHALHWTVLLLPAVLIPLGLLILGLSWCLASIGVFVRDIGHAVGLVTTLMLFLSPVFYPVSAVPETYKVLLYANPLTFLINQARDILVLGVMPDWVGLTVYCVCAYVVSWLGLLWFQKTRKVFTDVL